MMRCGETYRLPDEAKRIVLGLQWEECRLDDDVDVDEDEEEKIKGLKLLMKNQTGRCFEIDGKMAEAVAVIKVVISDLTAKARRKS